MRAGIAVSDSAAGHQLAIGILIALRERDRTGQGQWVKVSLLEAMISFLDFQAVRYTIDGHVPASEGNHHPTNRPMGTYQASDGHLNIAAPGERLWRRLCEVLGDPALTADERFATTRLRYENRLDLDAALDERFATRTRDEWIERLDAVGIPCGRVNTIDEVFADPQVRHLAMTATVDHATRGPRRRAAQPDHDVARRAGRADGCTDAGCRPRRRARRPRDPARALNRQDAGAAAWCRRDASWRRAGAPWNRATAWSAGVAAAAARSPRPPARRAGRRRPPGCAAATGAPRRATVRRRRPASCPAGAGPATAAAPVSGARPLEVPRQLDPGVGGVDVLTAGARRAGEPPASARRPG